MRTHPFESPRHRAARLPWIVLVGLAYLLLCLWNPLTTPGPVLCVARHAFAVPCPLCGATRGVALCLRGQPAEATRFNPLSPPLAAIGLMCIALWSYEYVANREVEFVCRRPWRIVFTSLAYFSLFATWIYLLTYCREDAFANSWLGQILQLVW
jgi:hypothetical protein